MDLSYRKLKTCMTIAAAAGGVTVFFFVIVVYSRTRSDVFQCGSSRQLYDFPKIRASNRRFLFSLPADEYNGDDVGYGAMDRILNSGGCSKESIYISQGQTPPLPSGIPTYTVQIQNICLPSSEIGTSCSISDIHLACGWFSSARLINPNVFKRISFDDCLVNNGNPISPGQTIFFQYANTFPYPMYVSSFTCN